MSRYRIVVADQGEAIFYDAPALDARPNEVGRISDPLAHLPDREFYSERPGRARESYGSARHAIQRAASPRHAEAVRFARRIARRLDEARRKDEFERAGRRRRAPVPRTREGGVVEANAPEGFVPLVPRSEIEGDMGDATMGVQARLMSQALRKLSGAINQTKTAVIFTNQLRSKIGVMFGNPETTTGGNALKFYASVRLDVRRIQAIKMGDEVIGNRTRVKVVKNKVAPPFRTAEFDIMFNEGESQSRAMFSIWRPSSRVFRSGAFFSYGDIRIGQGRENAKDYLRQNPDLMNEIDSVIRQKALSGEIAMPLEIGGGDSDSGSDDE